MMDVLKQLNRLGTKVVVDALRRINGLRGIICFGSYAQGLFDADSDVDLYVLWHPKAPDPDDRLSAFQQINDIKCLNINYSEPGWSGEEWFPICDRIRLNDVTFDIGHNTFDWLTLAIQKGRHFPQEPEGRRYLNMLGLLSNSVILEDRDNSLLELKSLIHPIPVNLKAALISENMSMLKSSLEDLVDYTRRGIGNTAFHFHLMRAVDAVGVILFAINERYDPMTKRVEEVFVNLPLAPPSFVERYSEIMSNALDERGREKTAKSIFLLAKDIEQLIREYAGANKSPLTASPYSQ